MGTGVLIKRGEAVFSTALGWQHFNGKKAAGAEKIQLLLGKKNLSDNIVLL